MSGDLAIDAVVHRRRRPRRRDWIAKPDTYNNLTRHWYLYRHSSRGVVQWCSRDNRKHTRRGGGCWKRCQSHYIFVHENTREDRASESQGKRIKGGRGVEDTHGFFWMGIERLQTRPFYRWKIYYYPVGQGGDDGDDDDDEILLDLLPSFRGLVLFNLKNASTYTTIG